MVFPSNLDDSPGSWSRITLLLLLLLHRHQLVKNFYLHLPFVYRNNNFTNKPAPVKYITDGRGCVQGFIQISPSRGSLKSIAGSLFLHRPHRFYHLFILHKINTLEKFLARANQREARWCFFFINITLFFPSSQN